MKEQHKSKIFTIIQHEYLTKVRSKGFIISTILGPIGLVVFIGIMVLVGYMSTQSGSKRIALLDRGAAIAPEIVKEHPDKYYLSTQSEEELKKEVREGQSDGYLIIPQDILETGKAYVYTSGGGGIGFISSLENALDKVVRHERLKKAGVDNKLISLVEKSVDIQTQKVTEKGVEKDYTEIYTGIGYVFGFLIYIMVLLYGSFVMRGVIEEKANRIVEVIASSAKPYEIMMGKVVGIGAVGLTQMLIWIIFAVIAMTFAGPIVNSFVKPETVTAAMNNTGNQAIPAISNFELPHISPWLYIGFIFYFLSGYFIYATLFAAVGSAVDQESDAQQLQWPVMMPIILPMLFIGIVMSDPDGLAAAILSLIPFFSPILMMVRAAATKVPEWQLALSVVLMILTFFGSVWAAAKVYRVGILMYGKRPTIKDMVKWVRLAK